MKIFLGTCKHRSVCFVKIKVVKFALDLGVMMTKIASLSKKPFLLVSIAWPGSFWFSEHDLE